MTGELSTLALSDIYVPREIPITSVESDRPCRLVFVLGLVFCVSVLAITLLVLCLRTPSVNLRATTCMLKTHLETTS